MDELQILYGRGIETSVTSKFYACRRCLVVVGSNLPLNKPGKNKLSYSFFFTILLRKKKDALANPIIRNNIIIGKQFILETKL